MPTRKHKTVSQSPDLGISTQQAVIAGSTPLSRTHAQSVTITNTNVQTASRQTQHATCSKGAEANFKASTPQKLKNDFFFGFFQVKIRC